jgi:prevent-host-death family protein
MTRSIAVSTLKAKALAIVEEVASTGTTVIITKRGKPVARLVPMQEPAPLLGSVTLLVAEEDFLAPAGQPWDAERGRP